VCFSPEADFAGAAVLGVLGVETLRHVRKRRELIIGALPAAAAAHQFTEGFVWLGLHGEVSTGVRATATAIFVIFAQVVLPIIVPIGFLLLEPERRNRRFMAPLVPLGLGVGGYLLWTVTQYPIFAVEHAHCVAYVTHMIQIAHHSRLELAVATLYVMATCGGALLSSGRYLRWAGAANLVGVAFAATMYYSEFTSVWCAYAALVSVLILGHLRRERRREADEVTSHLSGLARSESDLQRPAGVHWNPGWLTPGEGIPQGEGVHMRSTESFSGPPPHL
jgi:hypothetical protein